MRGPFLFQSVLVMSNMLCVVAWCVLCDMGMCYCMFYVRCCVTCVIFCAMACGHGLTFGLQRSIRQNKKGRRPMMVTVLGSKKSLISASTVLMNRSAFFNVIPFLC